MADVTVARAQREEMLPLAAERPAKAAARSFPVLPRSLMILWAGMVLVTGGFLLTGTMRIGAGNWIGRRMPVHEIWSRFLGFLTDLGASGPLILLVTAAAIVSLLVAALAFWLALALRDTPPESAADDLGGDVIAGRNLEHIPEALDLGVGVWARGPVRRRPHGGLRAIGGGRHPGRDHSPPEYLRQCRPPVPCGASGDPLARAGIR